MTGIAWQAALHRAEVPRVWTATILAGLLFVPAAMSFFVADLSFVLGTALMCALAVGLAMVGQVTLTARDVQIALLTSAAVALAVLVHLLVANVVDNDPRFDVARAISSLLLFGIVLLAVPVVCEAIMMSDSGTANIVRISMGIFILSATLAWLNIQPPSPSLGQKPTFPFTEPSFLGFSFPAILIFSMARSSLILRAGLVFAFLALGYTLGNLTIVAACLFAATVTLPVSWLIAGALALIAAETSLDLSYYKDRLDLDWATSINLSSLVYVQGWQMLEEALNKTHGWGVGFQQLGVVYTNVPASLRINMIAGRDANLQDGGFILAKLGGEFGVLGLALVAAYLYVAAQSFLALRAVAMGRRTLPDGEVFARACVIGYIIETFVRGSSYFTGTFVLLLAGLLYLYRVRHVPDSTETSPT